MLVAIAGAVAAITASGELRSTAGDRALSLDQTLGASVAALRTADDTVAIVASMVDQLVNSLATVADAALDSIATIDDAESGLHKLAEITGEDVPRIVESLQEAMPALIQVADVIDGTLGTLSIVGVPYDPDVPFDESLAGVAESIENLPEQVRQQAALIEEGGSGLGGIADQAGELIIEVGVAREQLKDGLGLLNQYRATTATAIEEVEAERGLIAIQVESEQSAIWWLGVAIVLAQIGLFTAGAWLTVRKDAVRSKSVPATSN